MCQRLVKNAQGEFFLFSRNLCAAPVLFGGRRFVFLAGWLRFVAKRQAFATRCLTLVGRARAVVRPRFGGRATVLARSCARASAADKSKAYCEEKLPCKNKKK